jgi:hypothetical protein
MATYRMVYGDDEQVVRETYKDITGVEHEDGWLVLFRGPEAILRVQDAHVKELELLEPAARRSTSGPVRGSGP